jgi:hypothetical protein
MGARDSLRDWLRAEIAKRKEIKAPDLTTAAIQEFADDKQWLREFVDQDLRRMVYAEVNAVIRETRQPRPIDSISFEALARDQQKNRIERWLDRMEHIGDKHMRLADMDRVPLQKAASIRFRIGNTNNSMGTLLMRLAGGLSGKEKVGEKFTDEQIEDLWTKISTATEKENSNGNLRQGCKALRTVPGKAPVPGQADGRNSERPQGDRGMAKDTVGVG